MAKEFKWMGKTEEEIKKMDLKEFLKFTNARARRSLIRGIPDIHKRVLQKVIAGDKNIKTQCRDMIIMPAMIGTIIRIYNGKEYLPVTITSEMLGHYLGEFAMTRKPVTHSAAGIGATRSSKAVSAR